MRRKLANLFLGLVFITIGACYALSIVFDWDFSIFFDGWWALFFIVPSVYDMINTKIRTGNIIVLIVGIWLFLSSQDRWDWDLWKLFVPILFILIGLSIIFKDRGMKISNAPKIDSQNGKIPYFSAFFAGNTPNFVGQEFEGAKVSAIFGGSEINLRNAIISKNCFIEATAIFGGVDIFLPPNVKVVFNSNPILGGCENKFISSTDINAPIVTINSTCIFGGTEIS